MHTARQSKREARQLFQFCVIDGSLDETRARDVVQKLISAGRPGALHVVSRLQRLLRLDRTRHSADVRSAAPLPSDVRTRLEENVTRVYGRGVVTSFAEDPSLIGGVRITIGSDVYDGSVKGRLTALESRF